LVKRLLLVGGFEPVNQCIATYLRAPLEVFSLVVGPTVFDRCPDPLFKCRGTYNELSTKTHTHQTYPSRIHVWSALEVIDGVLDSYTFAWEVEKGQRSLIVMYNMFVCHAQLTRLTHKQILTEVIADRCMEIMMRRRLVMAFCLGPFTHLLVHRPALRPFLAPVIPPLYTVRYTLEIIGVYAIGNKPGSPVVDRALYKFV